MGSLVVIGRWFVLTLAGLSAVAWFASLRLGRRRGPAAAIPVGVAAVLLTVATGADLVNAHYGYLPRVNDVIGRTTWPTTSLRELTAPTSTRTPSSASRRSSVSHRTGAVATLPIPGRVSGFGTHGAMVYLPPQYFTDPTRRFPVVYLLHGSPGAPIDWYRANRAAQTGSGLASSGQPAILVAPQVSRTWFDDSECVDRPHERIETYVVDDVIPTIDIRLRTLTDRDDRIFAGMSAGGFCALNLGLRHRGLVGAIVDMSGFDRPTHTGGMTGLFGHGVDLDRVLAGNTPVQYAPTLPSQPPLKVWLDCGRGDHSALADQRAMARILTGRGADVVLHLRPGGHDYNVWRPALRDGLGWSVPATNIHIPTS